MLRVYVGLNVNSMWVYMLRVLDPHRITYVLRVLVVLRVLIMCDLMSHVTYVYESRHTYI